MERKDQLIIMERERRKREKREIEDKERKECGPGEY